MKTIFHGKRVSGLLSVLPETAVRFEDEVDNYTFPAKQTLRLQKVMGYKQHRIVKESTATSDLCCAGLEYILERGWLKKRRLAVLWWQPLCRITLYPLSALSSMGNSA